MKRFLVPIAAVAAGFAFSAQASAGDLFIVSESGVIGLDYDGPAVGSPASVTAMVNLLEPLIYYVDGGANEEGVTQPDFSRFEGRLAESWTFDEDSLTWTFNLRRYSP